MYRFDRSVSKCRTASSSKPDNQDRVQNIFDRVRTARRGVCIAVAVVAGVAAVTATACSSIAPTTYADAPADVRAAVQSAALGPGDELEVRVYDETGMSGNYLVSPSGQIDFPLVGTVTVEGLAASQVAASLRQKLAQGYLRNPSVTAQVKTLNSKKVFVLGEVKAPGRFPFTDQMSVVEAVTLAGGFGSLAEKNFAIVTRNDVSGQRRIPVPVEKIMQGLAANFVLQPGDIVYIPETVL
ncbi:MAG: polysaccharide export protein [Myxococcales bacterium]|nr:polysaccharide export protein [Myxococcales bacterium]